MSCFFVSDHTLTRWTKLKGRLCFVQVCWGLHLLLHGINHPAGAGVNIDLHFTFSWKLKPRQFWNYRAKLQNIEVHIKLGPHYLTICELHFCPLLDAKTIIFTPPSTRNNNNIHQTNGVESGRYLNLNMHHDCNVECRDAIKKSLSCHLSNDANGQTGWSCHCKYWALCKNISAQSLSQ